MAIPVRNPMKHSWEQTKWLVLSSLLFLFPAAYGYIHRIHVLSHLLVVTSMVSANYWRHAVPGLRRDLDMFVSKIAIVVGISSGVWYVKENCVLFSVGILATAASYSMSSVCHRRRLLYWWKFHVAFHVILALEQILVFREIAGVN